LVVKASSTSSEVKGLVCYRRLIIQVERLLFNCCTERIEKERGENEEVYMFVRCVNCVVNSTS
jgi:hypothetical protein